MSTEDVARGRYYPDVPPAFEGEDDAAYTNRLTGADGTGRVPYDHRRGRECSLGFHLTCSGGPCECPHHTDPGLDIDPWDGPAAVRQADTLAELYYLPNTTARRVMHVARRAVDDGATTFAAVKDRLAAEYETELGDWFVVDVIGILGLTHRVDGIPQYQPSTSA